MSLHLLLTLLLLITYMTSSSVLGYKVNITHFGNCEEHKEVEIELKDVTYDYGSSGGTICDTVHGIYEIYIKRNDEEFELWMTINNCAKGSTGPCRDNEQKFIEPMLCERFHEDSNGPWYMISQATGHERCGEVMGTFDLTNATLRPEYLDSFISVNADLTRYRIQMLFHKKGASVESEKKHARGCVNMEFELII